MLLPLAVVASLFASEPSTRTVAITIDDLPFLGTPAPGESVDAATKRLVAAFASRKVPVTAFVTCGRSPKHLGVLARWTSGGAVLGNHTTSHTRLDALSDEAWERDVSGCGSLIQKASGEAPRFFRFPFLQSGDTPARRDWAAARLTALGYTTAPATIDTADWLIARAYAEALKSRDENRKRAVGAAFLDHVRAAAAHYREVSRDRIGRDVAHVLLLHASALTADYAASLLEQLSADGFRFIPLEEALADPVYSLPDGYAGPIGMSWLYRVKAADAQAWGWDVGQARALGERFGVAGEGLRSGMVRIERDLLARPIAPRTLAIVHEKPWAANSMVAELADGTLLLAGSPYTPDAARRLLGWLRARYGERKIVAVPTHFHFDASGGIDAYREAGARVIASDLTKRAIEEHRATLGKEVAAMIAGDPTQAALFERLEVPAPGETFLSTAGMKLDFGGERVELIYPGPGHTVDNIVVWLPARRVLFGGCLVIGMERVGYTKDADLARWPETIRGLKKLRAEVIIPGHGDRLGPDLLDHTLKLLAR